MVAVGKGLIVGDLGLVRFVNMVKLLVCSFSPDGRPSSDHHLPTNLARGLWRLITLQSPNSLWPRRRMSACPEPRRGRQSARLKVRGTSGMSVEVLFNVHGPGALSNFRNQLITAALEMLTERPSNCCCCITSDPKRKGPLQSFGGTWNRSEAGLQIMNFGHLHDFLTNAVNHRSSDGPLGGLALSPINCLVHRIFLLHPRPVSGGTFGSESSECVHLVLQKAPHEDPPIRATSGRF